MNLVISPARILRFNLYLISILLLLHLITTFISSLVDLPLNIKNIFDFSEERNLPTLYSGIALYLSSFLLLLYSYLSFKETNTCNKFVLVLSLIFAILGYDETFRMHEYLTVPIRERFDLTGLFYYSWVVPYLAIVIIVFLFSLSFLSTLDKRTRYLFLISGAIYVFGELFLEMLAPSIAYSASGIKKDLPIFVYTITTLEETLGMLGIALFNYSIIKLIMTQFNSLTIKIIDTKI